MERGPGLALQRLELSGDADVLPGRAEELGQSVLGREGGGEVHKNLKAVREPGVGEQTLGAFGIVRQDALLLLCVLDQGERPVPKPWCTGEYLGKKWPA